MDPIGLQCLLLSLQHISFIVPCSIFYFPFDIVHCVDLRFYDVSFEKDRGTETQRPPSTSRQHSTAKTPQYPQAMGHIFAWLHTRSLLQGRNYPKCGRIVYNSFWMSQHTTTSFCFNGEPSKLPAKLKARSTIGL